MGEMVLSYLRRDGIITNAVGNVSGVWLRVVPRDPTRYFLMIASNPTNVLSWWLDDSPPGAFSFNLPAGAVPLLFTEEDHGALVHCPLWLAAGVANVGYQVVAVGYQPRSYHIYQELMREFFSNRGAS